MHLFQLFPIPQNLCFFSPECNTANPQFVSGLRLRFCDWKFKMWMKVLNRGFFLPIFHSLTHIFSTASISRSLPINFSVKGSQSLFSELCEVFATWNQSWRITKQRCPNLQGFFCCASLKNWLWNQPLNFPSPVSHRRIIFTSLRTLLRLWINPKGKNPKPQSKIGWRMKWELSPNLKRNFRMFQWFKEGVIFMNVHALLQFGLIWFGYSGRFIHVIHPNF